MHFLPKMIPSANVGLTVDTARAEEEALPLLHYKQGGTLRGLAKYRTADGHWQRVEVCSACFLTLIFTTKA